MPDEVVTPSSGGDVEPVRMQRMNRLWGTCKMPLILALYYGSRRIELIRNPNVRVAVCAVWSKSWEAEQERVIRESSTLFAYPDLFPFREIISRAFRRVLIAETRFWHYSPALKLLLVAYRLEVTRIPLTFCVGLVEMAGGSPMAEDFKGFVRERGYVDSLGFLRTNGSDAEGLERLRK